MTAETRRETDALRAVDQLLDVHLQQTALGGRPLANLATAMAIDYSGADRGTLLIDDGSGLTPVLALAKELQASSRAASASEETIHEAVERRAVVARQRRVAAPILVGNAVRGVLALELDDGEFDEAVEELAGAVATRIATMLRSAELLEEISRRAQDMEALEALGAHLAAGKLRGRHFELAVENALQATHSSQAVLGLVDGHGELLSHHVRGGDAEAERLLCRDIAAYLTDRDLEERAAALLGDWHLFQPFWADLIPQTGADMLRRPAGFLAVRRDAPGPYAEHERSFFGALAHLLEGALARVEYFTRAAEDPLTETGSRLALQIALAEARATALKTGSPFSVILVDLDDFKTLNDSYGHLVGDEVLKGIADILRSRLRSQDSVARYGGDEFVIILPATPIEEAEHLAQELAQLAGRAEFGEESAKVSLSMGVDTVRSSDDSFSAILERADQALYAAKSAGRNRVSVAGETAPDSD